MGGGAASNGASRGIGHGGLSANLWTGKVRVGRFPASLANGILCWQGVRGWGRIWPPQHSRHRDRGPLCADGGKIEGVWDRGRSTMHGGC